MMSHCLSCHRFSLRRFAPPVEVFAVEISRRFAPPVEVSAVEISRRFALSVEVL
jgi:hypothetical protein